MRWREDSVSISELYRFEVIMERKKNNMLLKTFYAFWSKMRKDYIDASAAQSAFFVIMSFIPCVVLLLTLLQYTMITQEEAIAIMTGLMPDEFRVFIADLISGLYMQSTALVSTTIVAALWASGKAILAISNGLNRVLNLVETRNYLYMRLRSTGYTLLLLVALVLSMVLLVFGNQIHDYLLKVAPFLAGVSSFIISIRTVTILVMLTILFAAMYAYLPNQKRSIVKQLPGAIISSIAWAVFSSVFTVYLNFSRNLSAIYGSLSIAIMIMLWLYICMLLLFVGAEINAFIENPTAFFLTDFQDVVE